ncbi:DUF6804 family protein [Homoserinimonas sp. OAct 916]|uniref:DUF6804 family protein n=1 Tax=Homoserinimonas sp. OAct 916 TaxID=2211450 RepID=UPI000DBE14C0|nr:DUF6804 family protein [Homoserinimonas sp. OAct 916]
MSRNSKKPTRPEFSRAALVPGLLGAIALLAGLALLDSWWFIVIQFAAAILALIMCVYAIQAKAYWWLLGLAPIAIIWNPILPLGLSGQGWQFLQLLGALVFVFAGFKIKVPIAPNEMSHRGR